MKNKATYTLILFVILSLTNCNKSSSEKGFGTKPSYNDIENILKLKSSFTKLIDSESYSMSSDFKQKNGIKNNSITIELINPKKFPIPNELFSQQINLIRKKALENINNIKEFDTITLILKWNDKEIEKSKSIKI
jgi:hypothetical protein